MPKDRSRKVDNTIKSQKANALDGGRRELFAASLLMNSGFNVSIPIIDNRYDLIAEKYPEYYRIQVKPLSMQYTKNPKYATSVDQYIIHAYTNPRRQKMTYSKGDCDYVLAINLNDNNYALIPVEAIPKSGNVRVSERTNFAKCINNLRFANQ